MGLVVVSYLPGCQNKAYTSFMNQSNLFTLTCWTTEVTCYPLFLFMEILITLRERKYGVSLETSNCQLTQGDFVLGILTKSSNLLISFPLIMAQPQE